MLLRPPDQRFWQILCAAAAVRATLYDGVLFTARTIVMATASLNRLVQHLHDSLDDDRALLQRYLNRKDVDAIEALARRHGPTFLSACRKVLTDAADIDDVFQAAFLALLTNGGS